MEGDNSSGIGGKILVVLILALMPFFAAITFPWPASAAEESDLWCLQAGGACNDTKAEPHGVGDGYGTGQGSEWLMESETSRRILTQAPGPYPTIGYKPGDQGKPICKGSGPFGGGQCPGTVNKDFKRQCLAYNRCRTEARSTS